MPPWPIKSHRAAEGGPDKTTDPASRLHAVSNAFLLCTCTRGSHVHAVPVAQLPCTYTAAQRSKYLTFRIVDPHESPLRLLVGPRAPGAMLERAKPHRTGVAPAPVDARVGQISKDLPAISAYQQFATGIIRYLLRYTSGVRPRPGRAIGATPTNCIHIRGPARMCRAPFEVGDVLVLVAYLSAAGWKVVASLESTDGDGWHTSLEIPPIRALNSVRIKI